MNRTLHNQVCLQKDNGAESMHYVHYTIWKSFLGFLAFTYTRLGEHMNPDSCFPQSKTKPIWAKMEYQLPSHFLTQVLNTKNTQACGGGGVD